MVNVSIIVPVYNCAPYLSRCLDSIFAQTLTDFQLILVDDGSTDGSGEICDTYASADPRVQVIHQKNAGVSAARNAGLSAASGEYIGFVDADDWIAPHMFASLYKNAQATGGDIVMCDTVTVWENGRQEPDTIPLLAENRVLKKTDLTPEILRLMAGAVCRCLYRADLLALNQIRFPGGLPLSEDRIFNLQAMGNANTVSYLKEGFYFRAIRPGSATTSIRSDLFEMQRLAYDRAESILLAHWGEAYIPAYQNMLIIGGALIQIYQICGSKTLQPSLSGKLAAIRKIASHPAIAAYFASQSPKGIREKMLDGGHVYMLYLIGLLYRMKHGG